MSAHHYATALAKALGRLTRICCHYLGDEYSSKQEPKVSPEKDLETRQVNLNKVEATLLPAIRDLVVELLKVLDLPPKESMFPKTKLNNAWEIVHRLSSVLYKLRSLVTPPKTISTALDYLSAQISNLRDCGAFLGPRLVMPSHRKVLNIGSCECERAFPESPLV
ncbi:hypothetical protein PGT21_027456 [Puccinia graminis f. sp. tritici]|uniref:Uncharacterized protein n=1 Tax=Puccinia graminis f. sp. tritici TaxID=56615 RepID=A0A5B0QNP7_PUCGR|nr:hypothetical protein PGT21_027456 [Puccinia graminis f. sp. tritici]